MNKNKKQITKDEVFKIYVICYKEWCDEIDEMTKPVRVDIKIQEKEEFVYCFDCEDRYFSINRKENNRSPKHMKALIKENKYLLDWRVFNYTN